MLQSVILNIRGCVQIHVINVTIRTIAIGLVMLAKPKNNTMKYKEIKQRRQACVKFSLIS